MKLGRHEAPRRKPSRRASGCTFAGALAILAARPGVEESTSYRTPAIKVNGKLLARLREDGETLVVRIEPDARDLLLASDPETFFITDHYAAHPWVLVSLPRVAHAELTVILEQAFDLLAPEPRAPTRRRRR